MLWRNKFEQQEYAWMSRWVEFNWTEQTWLNIMTWIERKWPDLNRPNEMIWLGINARVQPFHGGNPARHIGAETCTSFRYGSKAMKIPFLMGWTSINPSYFDVNRRGIYIPLHISPQTMRAPFCRVPSLPPYKMVWGHLQNGSTHGGCCLQNGGTRVPHLPTNIKYFGLT